MHFSRILSLSIVLVCCLFSSCIYSQDSTQVKEELLLTIANDQDFKKYRVWVLKSARLVALKEVDFEGIDKVLNENPLLENLDLCNEQLKKKLAPVQGGDVYWENHCQISTLSKQLEKKFKFSSFTDEEIKTMFKFAAATDGITDELERDILNQEKN